jgi:sugar/nucleoside kinase (ribokinase family)
MAAIWTMGELLCEVMRPEIDKPLDKAGLFMGPYPSGAPAIFIDTAARLGQTAGIIGGVGRDDFGKCLLDRLRQSGVDCSFITEYDTGATGVAFVTYFADGSRRFLYHFPDTPATWAKAPDSDKLGDVGYFHIMGCSLMADQTFGDEIIKLMRGLANRGTKISFDPNIRAELMRDGSGAVREVMAHCNVLLPGRAELLTVSGKETIREAVTACFENPRLEVIAMKDGAKGCTVFTRDKEFSLGVYPVEGKDPTGAGDAFDAAFEYGGIRPHGGGYNHSQYTSHD